LGRLLNGLKLDLPTLRFDPTGRAAGSWFNLEIEAPVLGRARWRCRFTRYEGDRDTEPRAATAHAVSFATSADDEAGARFILIDVHLSTLKAEDTPPQGSPEPGAVWAKRRVPTLEAAWLRYLQLSVLRDFILEVYGELQLPVLVAGDFNAQPDAPEMRAFLEEARLRPVFGLSECWRCGRPYQPMPEDAPRRFLTRAPQPEFLAATPEEFAAWSTEPAQPILTRACCRACGAPCFTHKRNFSLLDNLLFTDPDQAASLRFRLRPDLSRRGICLHTAFSDHAPIWCKFACSK
jgi:hypothetical protein